MSPAANKSTALDLNAGRGTERGAPDSAQTPSGARRPSTAARSKREDAAKPSPDGPQGGGDSGSAAYEGESLRERSSRTDVEGGVG